MLFRSLALKLCPLHCTSSLRPSTSSHYLPPRPQTFLSLALSPSSERPQHDRTTALPGTSSICVRVYLISPSVCFCLFLFCLTHLSSVLAYHTPLTLSRLTGPNFIRSPRLFSAFPRGIISISYPPSLACLVVELSCLFLIHRYINYRDVFVAATIFPLVGEATSTFSSVPKSCDRSMQRFSPTRWSLELVV